MNFLLFMLLFRTGSIAPGLLFHQRACLQGVWAAFSGVLERPGSAVGATGVAASVLSSFQASMRRCDLALCNPSHAIYVVHVHLTTRNPMSVVLVEQEKQQSEPELDRTCGTWPSNLFGDWMYLVEGLGGRGNTSLKSADQS